MPPIFAAVELDDYLDVSQTMLLTLSDAGCVLHVNRAGCELLGRNRDDILRSNWFDSFVPASMRSRMRELLAPTLAGDEEVGHFEAPVISRTRGSGSSPGRPPRFALPTPRWAACSSRGWTSPIGNGIGRAASGS